MPSSATRRLQGLTTGLIDPEDVPQDIGDLPECRHPTQSLPDRDENILSPLGRRDHIGEGGVDGPLIP